MARTNEKNNPMTWNRLLETVNVTAWCDCKDSDGRGVGPEEWELFDLFYMAGGSTPETATTLRRVHGFMHPACGRMTQEG